ncbi:MAG: hypothetical protein O0V67_06460 [Methanocorpusculum sp.]|nr:hypothetical protein [Methanocorpusculum sp.]
MGDFLGDLKKGLNKSVEDLNKSVKTLEIQSKISSLKKDADAVYAEIGKRAVEESGPEKYGELGDKLQIILAEIKTEEEKLPADAAETKKTKTCPGCSAENPGDARFCSCCGEMFEDQNP